MKRKYEEKLIFGINKNSKFLIERLRNEWEDAQKAGGQRQRTEKIVAISKKSGIILGKIILTLLMIGGTLTIAVVAPNMFAVFGRFRKFQYYFKKNNIKDSFKYLKSQKYIKIIKKDKDEYEIYLEKKGNKRVLKENFSELKIFQPARWDSHWRMVIFDIPDKYKWAREGFREKLKTMGFYQLQESVFIYPHGCWEEIEFLCSVFSINNFVRFIESKTLIPADDVKVHFSLK